jgi:pre-mRNA-splicing helicase BRR2
MTRSKTSTKSAISKKYLVPFQTINFLSSFLCRKKITDYGAEDEAVVDPDIECRDAEIDNELGVAVVFDEDQQEESDDEHFEIRDESDDEDTEQAGNDSPDSGDLGEEDIVITGDSSTRKQKADKDIVPPHSIDAFWVQRQISEVYPDPGTATEKTASALTILGSESSLRDCKNQLMELIRVRELSYRHEISQKSRCHRLVHQAYA